MKPKKSPRPRKKEWPMVFSKDQFWKYVNQVIGYTVDYRHVLGIISVLFDEMSKDFKEGKDIKIHNFGTFSVEKLAARNYFDFRFKKTLLSAGTKRQIKFTFIPAIYEKLHSFIDPDKTFADENE